MGVTRWRRYGKDRLYVTDTDGGDIGWWDLVADAAHPTAPEAEVALRAAVKAWQAGAQAAPVVPETAAATAATVPINPDVVPHGPDFLPPDLPPAATDPLAAPVVADVQPAVEQFAPPQGPPVVDLAWNRPGEQLADKVAAARAAGERPTLWRGFWLGKNAYSTWERGAIGERLVAEELAKLVGRDSRWGSSTRSPSATRPTSTCSSSGRAGCSPSTPNTTAEPGSGSAATPSWSTA